MYDSLRRGCVTGIDYSNPDSVLHHVGRPNELLARHREDASRAVQSGLQGVRSIAPYLVGRISDARTLRTAWDFLDRMGGQAPGPNGRRYSDYTSAEVWSLCRCVGQAIRSGSYRPGSERIVWVDKASGAGQRPIVLQDIEDRMVQRAIYLVMNPLIDSLLDPHALGFRERRGPLHALALAEYLTRSEKRRVWVVEDIKDAFQHVPLNRLFGVVEKVLPASDLIALLERVVPGQYMPGLRQGGPLSPMLLNLYLGWFQDRPWRRDHPDTLMIRVADDFLALCRSDTEAANVRPGLLKLLVPAGFTLKPADKPIRDLDAGEAAHWIGYKIRNNARGLAVGIAERAWGGLDHLLARAHYKSDAQLRASQTAKQWLIQRSPCFRFSKAEQVCKRVVDVARLHAFEEVPDASSLKQFWQRAASRWRELRKEVRETYRQTGSVIGASACYDTRVL
jgi:hypothetical protein